MNSDVISEIIGHMDQGDRQTALLNLSLVSQPFYRATRPALFANVKWPHPAKYDDGGLIFLPEKLWCYFKTLHFDWPAEWSEGDSPLWGSKEGDKYTPRHLDKLEAALPCMSGLQTLQITCPFDPPLSLFRALQECTSVMDLKITDTPVWNALKDPGAPVLFTAERITFSPVGEGARMGEGHYDRKFRDFISYMNAEYRRKYFDFMMHRTNMNYSPPGLPFLLRCRVETMTYLQLSGDYLSLDDFRNPGLSFPVLETLILTGPWSGVAPGSTMSLPEVISLMPRLRDLRVLINDAPIEHLPLMAPLGSVTPLAVYRRLAFLAISNRVRDIAAVLQYANGLERLAITATVPLPHLTRALRMLEVERVLESIRQGGGGQRLKQFRVTTDQEFYPPLVKKLGDFCPNLEVVELELCSYKYYDNCRPWAAYATEFSHYCHLKTLRIGIRFPRYNPDKFKLCAIYFAQRLQNLRRIGLEYRTKEGCGEDRWMDFDIIRGPDGSVRVLELPFTWYEFPEMWKRVPLVG